MRLKLLNGAPLCEQLDFSNETLLDIAKCKRSNARAWGGQSTEEEFASKWRDIGWKNARLHTGWSQPHLPGTALQSAHDKLSFSIPGIEETSTLPDQDTTNLDTLDEEFAAATDYLQHSLIFHDTLMSSQVVQHMAEDNTVNSSSFLTTSFGSTASGTSSPSPMDRHTPLVQVPSAMSVMPLGSLPSAHYLRSIYPQTPTPNFLCALMTLPERREVFVRKGSYRMDLWEVVVGDDTRSNFKVTFWLPPSRESNEQNHVQVELLQTLARLQVGDILLLRNIALTSFSNIVYGQSLNTAITRAKTSLDVLLKGNGESMARVGELPASVIESFMKVKKWTRSHVAGDNEQMRKRRAEPLGPGHPVKRSSMGSARDEDLPPDTMEDT